METSVSKWFTAVSLWCSLLSLVFLLSFSPLYSFFLSISFFLHFSFALSFFYLSLPHRTIDTSQTQGTTYTDRRRQFRKKVKETYGTFNCLLSVSSFFHLCLQNQKIQTSCYYLHVRTHEDLNTHRCYSFYFLLSILFME